LVELVDVALGKVGSAGGCEVVVVGSVVVSGAHPTSAAESDAMISRVSIRLPMSKGYLLLGRLPSWSLLRFGDAPTHLPKLFRRRGDGCVGQTDRRNTSCT
jgi:hypothetical protein